MTTENKGGDSVSKGRAAQVPLELTEQTDFVVHALCALSTAEVDVDSLRYDTKTRQFSVTIVGQYTGAKHTARLVLWDKHRRSSVCVDGMGCLRFATSLELTVNMLKLVGADEARTNRVMRGI